MAFFNEFPHTRNYDSDLGWLIKVYNNLVSEYGSLTAWKAEHEQEYIELKDLVDTLTSNLINVIKPWDGTIAYKIYTIVSYEDNSYIAIKDVPAGILITNTNYWQIANTVLAQIGAIGSETDNLMKSLYVYTPDRFGAVGDGVTDDSQSFQNCVNACIADGKALYLTGKKYKIHDVTWSGDLEIFGGDLTADHYDNNTNQFLPLLICNNGNIYLHDIRFTGCGTALASTVIKYHFMHFTNCILKVERCEFSEISTKNSNSNYMMYYERFGLTLTATDCNVYFNHNYIHDMGNEELMWICPTDGDNTNMIIEFTNNRCVNLQGYSFNLIGKKVTIKDNYFFNFFRVTSIFNVSQADLVTVEGNTFEECSTQSAIDTSEEGKFYCDTVIIKNNFFSVSPLRTANDGYPVVFAVCRARVVDITDNTFSGDQFYYSSSDTQPQDPATPWTMDSGFDGKLQRISNNTLHIGGPRATSNGAINVWAKSLTGFSTLTSNRLEKVELNNNYIDFMIDYAPTSGRYRYSPFIISCYIDSAEVVGNTVGKQLPPSQLTSNCIFLFCRWYGSEPDETKILYLNVDKNFMHNDTGYNYRMIQRDVATTLTSPIEFIETLIIGVNVASGGTLTNIGGSNQLTVGTTKTISTT